ncbi:tyrosine-type recombinase/integrase [Vibrio sp. 10N.222.54.B6]|uniref:tyrosine-type recombinase/integrase n=1 Tax=Vibrio sp. 10N.222.54.B6 TaxID=1884468 RepID=UPI000C829241|nr:tyrosine-type recombinase/integrase [Vibrio sp. 10N.222.54.B6]PMO23110.1 hypothetical protein BCT16_04930 [Vibrio sp. 10N.222.54.B6]
MNRQSHTAKHIHHFYQQHSLACAEVDAFEAFLTLLSQERGQESEHERQLTESQMASINRAISGIPTGRQRALKRARDETLYYLNQVCGWDLPPVKVQQFNDHEHLWLVSLYQQSARAHAISMHYQQESLHRIKHRGSPNLAWTVLTLMREVAPLPLNAWCERLNDPTPLERIGDQLTLTITHPVNLSYFDDTEPVSFTRYAVSPLAARAFYDWQCQQEPGNPKVTLNRLLNSLDDFYPSAQRKALTPHQWQQSVQTLWLHRFAIPPEILKDFSDPMRHVSALPQEAASSRVAKAQDIYQPPSFAKIKPKDANQETPFHRWPHAMLIKSLNTPQQAAPTQPEWQADNLLPRLLFDYVQELKQFGGVKKNTLSPATLLRYTSFKNELSTTPLPLSIANDREALQQWAKDRYRLIQDETMEKWTLYQFFRFLTQQSITEHLDLSTFIKPTQSLKIDALSLSAEEVHHLVTQLLTHSLSPMQALFASVSALLSYYGALRRGELLRLRLQDIRCTHEKGQLFAIYITNTEEGKTKSGDARTVQVVMPEIGAKLIRLLLAFKANRPPSEPFIGFEGESIHLRARHYLLPITKVLKQLHGKKARFHHLRHSGAKLLYQQALCLANGAAPKAWHKTHQPVTASLFSTSVVEQRFQYWLQGRSFSELNNMLLFDEIGRMLGHQHYATTRLHYLHGMEWVAPAFLPQQREYTHAELRYLWGMKPGSNDITRLLMRLSPQYAQLSPSEKQRHLPSFTHAQLAEALSQRLGSKRKPSGDQERLQKAESNDNEWIGLWTKGVSSVAQTRPYRFQWETREQIKRLKETPLAFSMVSDAWRAFGQYQGIEWNKAARTALRPLGELHLEEKPPQSDDEGMNNGKQLYFLSPCNQKVEKALHTLKQSPLKYHCHITLHQNRKRLDSNKWDFIQAALLTAKDTANKIIIPTGRTQLKIALGLEVTDPLLLEQFQTWWNTMILNASQQKGHTL